MPRSSPRRSHGFRDGSECSGSEDGGASRKEEADEASGTRNSSALEPEKREFSSSPPPILCPDGLDSDEEHVEKRDYREDYEVADDRWDGGKGTEKHEFSSSPPIQRFDGRDSDEEHVEKLDYWEDDEVADDRWDGGKGMERLTSEIFAPTDLEVSMGVDLSGDSKSWRGEGSVERYDGSGSKAVLENQKSGKDSSRRRSGSRSKERGRERRPKKDKSVSNSRHGKSDSRHGKSGEVSGRGARTTGVEKHDVFKKDKETAEWDFQDELHNPELEKELEHPIRRRDGSDDKDKWQGDNGETDGRCRENVGRRYVESSHRGFRGNEDKQHKESENRWYRERDGLQLLSADRTKNCSYGDVRHKGNRNSDGRYSRDNCLKDLDSDHKKRVAWHHEQKSCKDCDGGRYVEGHMKKFRDVSGEKRSFDENDDKGLKLQSTKQCRGDVENNESNTNRLGTHMEKTSAYRSKNSPRSPAVRGPIRYSSKLGESAHRKSMPRERFHSSVASSGHDASISGEREKDLESFSSVSDSVQDGNTFASGVHEAKNRYKRNNYNTGRGEENPWSMLPWPHVVNDFTPFQHGPPYPGLPLGIQQYAPSALFGIRPSMDMNPTGFTLHMHEVAERFSGHVYSFGWHDTYGSVSHLQGWNGATSVFSGQSHPYGRAAWEPNGHGMGSQRWETNARKPNGSDGYMNMEFSICKKELEHTTGHLTDDECTDQSGHCSHKEQGRSESISDEKTEFGKLYDTSSTKLAIDVHSDTMHEKVTKASEDTSDDSLHVSCRYLSKIDISKDLSSKELYEQCMTQLGATVQPGEATFPDHGYSETVNMDAKEAEADENYISNHGFPERMDDVSQVNKRGAKVASEGSSYILNSVIPKARGDVFQRAISLYKKQSEASKLKVSGSTVLQKEAESTSEAFDKEKVRPVDYQTTSHDNVGTANIKEEANAIADAETGDADDAKEGHSDFIESSLPCEAKMQGCRSIQSSQSYKAKMPDCRLSRIHDSPGSRH